MMVSKLVVVKVGTSGITNTEGDLDIEEMSKLAYQIAVAMKQGAKVVLVTSVSYTHLTLPTTPYV